MRPTLQSLTFDVPMLRPAVYIVHPYVPPNLPTLTCPNLTYPIYISRYLITLSSIGNLGLHCSRTGLGVECGSSSDSNDTALRDKVLDCAVLPWTQGPGTKPQILALVQTQEDTTMLRILTVPGMLALYQLKK